MKLHLLQRAVAAAVLMVMSVSAAWADSARIIITSKSGTVAEFLLAESPVITYHDNLLEVKGGGKEISLEAEEVGSFDFVPAGESGVEEITVDASRFSGLRAGSLVEVYNFDGRRVATFPVDDSGAVSVEMGNLAPGLYIVRTSGATFKIKKN